jgi:inhibitor of cysteine peptidase
MDESVITPEHDEIYVGPGDDAPEGEGGLSVWDFMAVGSGESTLRLIYQFPGDEEANDVFEINVVVAPSLEIPVEVGDTPEMSLTAEDSGQEIHLEPGEEVEIILDSNPTTGYEWTLAKLDEAVLVQSGEVDYVADEPVAPGSGGLDSWRFEAVAPGTTTLRLEYAASYESNPEPVEVFVITVIVE